MRAVDLIRRKRDGGVLSEDEIRWVIEAYTEGGVGSEQMAALAMAIYFKGMTAAELATLTDAMIQSGNTIDFSGVEGVKVDKHSTGGVGDKVSICLAPLVATCGVAVPMMSGRGLGHTGGTLDKLSAIPGFSSDVDDARFVELVGTHGFALIGQTQTLAPADKKLYALRDVTGTVESIPLISASILSKKLAEGIDALVLDVKVGSGAFMKTIEDARALAKTMTSVGEKMGKRVRALLTNMDDVLGAMVGNANEVWEALDVLKGGGPQDLVELTVELGAEMLCLGHVAESIDDGRTRIRRAMKDGRGLEKLKKLVEAQGGDPASLEDRTRLGVAKHESVITAPESGILTGINVEAIGTAGMLLGAGRARIEDEIDVSVGIEMKVKRGDKVEAGQALAKVSYNEASKLAEMTPVFLSAFQWGEEEAPAIPLVRERL